MPAKDRSRSDQQGHLGTLLLGDEPEQCRHDGSVALGEAGPWLGTACDRQLMPKHQDLRVLRGIRTGEQGKPSEGLAGEQVDQPYHHDQHAASKRLAAPEIWADPKQRVSPGGIIPGTHRASTHG